MEWYEAPLGDVSHPLVKQLQEARLDASKELQLTAADMRELALCLIWGSGHDDSQAIPGSCYLPLEALAWAEAQQQEGGWDGVGNGEAMLKLVRRLFDV